MWNYTNAVHEHFLRPHNAGPMEDANAIGEVGSLACGDALKLYLKINDEGEYHKINEAYAQGGHKQAVKALEEEMLAEG